jgi:hypothetical protein
MAQRISPNALQALTDALATMFWYKSDLRTYLVAATGEPALIASLDWDTYKRRIADEFIQRLVGEQDTYREVLVRLMVDVAAVEDFPKLRGVEDEAEKVAEAKGAIAELRKYIKPYEQEMLEREKAEQKIGEARSAAAEQRNFQDKLAELKARYETLVGMEDSRARGLALEPLLRDLFALFDLDPRGSFALRGEQIDGSFSLGETHFLLEAKWTKGAIERKDLDAFKAKVEGKIENTLGLFVSINGFQVNAVQDHSSGALMLMMNGADLYMVLDGRVDLVELLKRKYRHASETGEVLFEATRML